MSAAPTDPSALPDLAAAEAHLTRALTALDLGDDPEMATTPERVAGFLAEFRPVAPPTTTPLETRSSSPVVVRDLPYHSLCAHHLLPFFGRCTIAYRPAGRIAGLGWFPRLVSALARRPQLQERLAEEVAQAVYDNLAPTSVAVCVTARQMCVEMRGARSTGQFEVTAVTGEPDARLLDLVRPTSTRLS